MVSTSFASHCNSCQFLLNRLSINTLIRNRFFESLWEVEGFLYDWREFQRVLLPNWISYQVKRENHSIMSLDNIIAEVFESIWFSKLTRMKGNPCPKLLLIGFYSDLLQQKMWHQMLTYQEVVKQRKLSSCNQMDKNKSLVKIGQNSVKKEP